MQEAIETRIKSEYENLKLPFEILETVNTIYCLGLGNDFHNCSGLYRNMMQFKAMFSHEKNNPLLKAVYVSLGHISDILDKMSVSFIPLDNFLLYVAKISPLPHIFTNISKDSRYKFVMYYFFKYAHRTNPLLSRYKKFASELDDNKLNHEITLEPKKFTWEGLYVPCDHALWGSYDSYFSSMDGHQWPSYLMVYMREVREKIIFYESLRQELIKLIPTIKYNAIRSKFNDLFSAFVEDYKEVTVENFDRVLSDFSQIFLVIEEYAERFMTIDPTKCYCNPDEFCDKPNCKCENTKQAHEA